MNSSFLINNITFEKCSFFKNEDWAKEWTENIKENCICERFDVDDNRRIVDIEVDFTKKFFIYFSSEEREVEEGTDIYLREDLYYDKNEFHKDKLKISLNVNGIYNCKKYLTVCYTKNTDILNILKYEKDFEYYSHQLSSNPILNGIKKIEGYQPNGHGGYNIISSDEYKDYREKTIKDITERMKKIFNLFQKLSEIIGEKE